MAAIHRNINIWFQIKCSKTARRPHITLTGCYKLNVNFLLSFVNTKVVFQGLVLFNTKDLEDGLRITSHVREYSRAKNIKSNKLGINSA